MMNPKGPFSDPSGLSQYPTGPATRQELRERSPSTPTIVRGHGKPDMNDSDPHLPAIERAASLLRGRRSVLFITGAGISADSGLPTYRGVESLYHVNTTEDGMSIEEALSGGAPRRDPELAWKYPGQIEAACRGAQCNRAHEVVVEVENHFERVWTLTRNVDGFHRAAGSKNVIDIHGDLHRLRCTACDFRETVEDFRSLALPPLCPRCEAVLRPDVVLFGEMLPARKVLRLQEELDRGFDCVFTIGATSVFPCISEPVEAARQRGRPAMEINPGRSAVSHRVEVKVPLGAARGLDLIWSRYRQQEEAGPGSNPKN